MRSARSCSLDNSFIREATLEDNVTYVHPVVVAAKKDSAGEWKEKRFCIDLRNTNSCTDQEDPYQMPLVDDLFAKMASANFFTTCDMRAGFNNVPVEHALQRNLAFYLKGKIFVCTRMCFGHRNAPAMYQRVMDALIAEAGVEDSVVVYIDDVVIHTANVEEHLKLLEKLLAVFRKYGMKVHPKKTLLLAQDIEFLGHRVHPGGLSPHEAKLSGFRNLRDPANVSEVRSLVGTLAYYVLGLLPRVFAPDGAHHRAHGQRRKVRVGGKAEVGEGDGGRRDDEAGENAAIRASGQAALRVLGSEQRRHSRHPLPARRGREGAFVRLRFENPQPVRAKLLAH